MMEYEISSVHSQPSTEESLKKTSQKPSHSCLQRSIDETKYPESISHVDKIREELFEPAVEQGWVNYNSMTYGFSSN